MDNVERVPIQRATKEGKKDTEGIVIKELPLTIILNNQELVTLLCSPTDLKYLAIGFLAAVFSICDGSSYFRFGVCDLHRSIVAGAISFCYSIY
jgi:formate dehydrogenase assembly factor FdhD